MMSTHLSYLTFERTYGRPAQPVDVSSISETDPIKAESEYFQRNIGRVSNGRELVADDRLYRYAMTAFGLDDQIENREFMINVFDQGVFDPFTELTADQKANGFGESAVNKIAEALWFDKDFHVPGEIDRAIDKIANRYMAISQAGAATKTEEATYFRDTVKSMQSGKQLVQNERLYRFVLVAFGAAEEYGNRELIGKAIDAGVYNPRGGELKEGALANTARDSRFNTIARAFAFNEIGDQNVRDESFVKKVVGRYEKEALSLQSEETRNVPGRQDTLPKQYEREMQYFRENIGSVSSVEEFMADDRLYRFALTAFDLESQIPYRGLIKKALEEGVTDPAALSNKLVDKKFKTFAAAFGFAESGDRNVRNPNFAEDVIDKFKRVKVESKAGEENVGVRLAAYFDRKGQNLKSWFQVLGDKAMREVVFTAFDLPKEMQTTNPDKLVSIFEQRMDIEDLKDPAKRKKFIERFTLMYDIKNGAPGGAGGSSGLLSLYGVSPGGGGGGNGIVSIDPSTTSAKLFG